MSTNNEPTIDPTTVPTSVPTDDPTTKPTDPAQTLEWRRGYNKCMPVYNLQTVFYLVVVWPCCNNYQRQSYSA